MGFWGFGVLGFWGRRTRRPGAAGSLSRRATASATLRPGGTRTPMSISVAVSGATPRAAGSISRRATVGTFMAAPTRWRDPTPQRDLGRPRSDSGGSKRGSCRIPRWARSATASFRFESSNS